MEAAHPLPVNNKLSPAAFQTLFVLLRIAADIGVSFAVPLLAYLLRFDILSPDIPKPSLPNYMLLCLIFAGVNFYFFIFFGTYKPVRGRSLIDETFGVIKVAALGAIILIAITFFVTRFSYSRLTVTYTILLSFFFLGAERSLILLLERNMLRSGHGHKKLLIVGTGQHADILTTAIPKHPEMGFTLCGYLEEEMSPLNPAAHLLGEISELEKVIIRNQILEIIVCLKPGSHHEVTGIVDLCDRYGIECLVSPDLEQMIVGAHHYDEIAGIPVTRIKGLRMRGISLFMKRASDVAISSFIMIFLTPIFIFIAILIRMDSPGPIFYMQKRVGMDGDEFWMYKFRSMRAEAEERDGPAWSQTADPRVTRLGNVLRKLSIDELPQIFNVLKGEMSLIGPRPERAYFVEQFKKVIPRYMERHTVKTGMSGWAQVNGFRGDTSIEERVKYDLYYIENWSLWFDLKIMILTAFDILKEIKKLFGRGKKEE